MSLIFRRLSTSGVNAGSPVKAGIDNAIATGAATTPERQRIAEQAAAETVAAAAAAQGPLTPTAVADAADRGQNAAFNNSPAGAGSARAANAGAAGAAIALLNRSTGVPNVTYPRSVVICIRLSFRCVLHLRLTIDIDRKMC